MKALIIGGLASLAAITVAFANEIYVNQAGAGLTLTITQTGQDNEFGNSTTDAVLNGTDTTITLTQTGDFNTVDATIKGITFTGTWSFIGDNNTLDLLCSSAATGECDSATMTISNTGDDTDYVIYVGETSSADNATVSFTVTGDGDAVYAEIDGESAAVTVTSDSSASLSTTSSSLLSPASLSTSAGGNLYAINVDGDGDIAGHTVNIDVTGGGNSIIVTQSGIYDNDLDLTLVGDDGTITITQTD
jgi:hypothetical protein|tara:strand:- start:1101 stop:1841 length:741 start_codon:yes stop_codon:yes gene_type:complete